MMDADIDAWIWGAEAIAAEVSLLDKNGDPDERAAFYRLEKGHLPGKKVNGRWVTTRRLLNSVIGV